MTDKTPKRLIRNVFLRLMISNVLVTMTTSACGLIDNMFISRLLGEEALAATGFFSPVLSIVSLAYVVIVGTQLLTGNLVGEGKTKQVNQLFVSSFLLLAAFSAVLAIVSTVFNQGLAGLLGARGEAFTLLCDYIKGYAPGIIPQMLMALLMALCSFNNDIRRTYFSIGTMIAADALGDWLLLDGFGLFGIGLASSISTLAALLVLLPGFFRKDKLFHFQLKDGLNFRLVLSAMRRGSPTLMLAFGVLLRNLCMNYSLQMFVGAAGVAVAGVMATVNSLASAIPVGCCNGFSTLASIYFGEEDRESLLDLAFSAMRIGLLSCAAATGFIMLMSKPFAIARRAISLQNAFVSGQRVTRNVFSCSTPSGPSARMPSGWPTPLWISPVSSSC